VSTLVEQRQDCGVLDKPFAHIFLSADSNRVHAQKDTVELGDLKQFADIPVRRADSELSALILQFWPSSRLHQVPMLLT